MGTRNYYNDSSKYSRNVTDIFKRLALFSKHEHIFKSGRSRILSGPVPNPRGARGSHPNSFDFMQFSGKFGKIVCWRSVLGMLC